MSATLDEMAKRKPPAEASAEQQAAVELVRMAKEKGLSLTGPDGLLKLLTKSVIETALGEEMTDHLGYEKHDPVGIGAENIRNGTRAKTVISGHSGPVEIAVECHVVVSATTNLPGVASRPFNLGNTLSHSSRSVRIYG
jgi:putative transposase